MMSSTALHGEPFVSIRESIAWLPSAPFEDSDVLVLSSRSTSPGAGASLFFLDLRLSLPLSQTSAVNWGFAGLRHTLSTSPLRFQWDHSRIDSREEGAVDEGEVIQRDGMEIETGIGFNPATNKMEPYEEIWRDEPLPAGSPYIFVSSSAVVEEATAVMAVLGHHALALAQEADGTETNQTFEAVRMRRRANTIQHAQETAWEVVTSTGNPPLEQALKELAELADQGSQYSRGSNICLGGRTWFVWDTGRTGVVRDRNDSTS